MKELDALRADFQDLCKSRNDLLHATYFIGPGTVEITDKDRPIETHVEKRAPDKNGARTRIIASTLDEQHRYVRQAVTVKEKFSSFNSKVFIALYQKNPDAFTAGD